MNSDNDRPLWATWIEIEDGDRTGGWGVYAICNVVTGRALISGSTDIAKRLWDARKCLDHGRHWNRGVQADLDLHGAATFRLYLVRLVESATLLKITKYAEQQRAAALGVSYNLKPVYRSRPIRQPPSSPRRFPSGGTGDGTSAQPPCLGRPEHGCMCCPASRSV